MKKKTILFYTDCWEFGGSEKTIFELTSSVKFISNFDYVLIYRFNKPYFEGMLKFKPSFRFTKTIPIRLPDISIWIYSLSKKISSKYLLIATDLFLRITFRVFQPLFFMYDFIILFLLFSKQKAEVVHINNGGYPGALGCLAAAVAAKAAGKSRIIMTINNIAIKRKGLFEMLVDYLIRNSVNSFVSGSKAATSALCEKRGFNRNRMIQIYHGINLLCQVNSAQTLCTSERNKIKQVVMIALFEDRKGHHFVLKALKKLLIEHPEYSDIELVLIGDGPLFKEMKNLVQVENLNNNVCFLGYRRDYIGFLKTSLLLLNPSIGYEDLPYIIIEAMSLGIPAIGTDVGGIPEEIENGITGIIVPPKDVDSLVNAMLLLLSDEKIRLKMGKNAKKRFEDLFTIEKMTEKYIKLYFEAASNFKNYGN